VFLVLVVSGYLLGLFSYRLNNNLKYKQRVFFWPLVLIVDDAAATSNYTRRNIIRKCLLMNCSIIMLLSLCVYIYIHAFFTNNQKHNNNKNKKKNSTPMSTALSFCILDKARSKQKRCQLLLSQATPSRKRKDQQVLFLF